MSGYADEKQIKDKYNDRISLAKCKEILNAKEYGYTDEEVLIIRDFLYSLGAVDYHNNEIQHQQATIIIELKPLENVQSEKCHPLHPGKHRRAS